MDSASARRPHRRLPTWPSCEPHVASTAVAARGASFRKTLAAVRQSATSYALCRSWENGGGVCEGERWCERANERASEREGCVRDRRHGKYCHVPVRVAQLVSASPLQPRLVYALRNRRRSSVRSWARIFLFASATYLHAPAKHVDDVRRRRSPRAEGGYVEEAH